MESVARARPDDSARAPLDRHRARTLRWIPVLPFLVYISLFLLLPTLWLAGEAFRSNNGSFTLEHVRKLFEPQYRNAYLTSVKLSLVTALGGGISGIFVASAMTSEGAPRWVRTTFTSFSAVAAHFAGVPLAFAFVATLGSTGVVTAFLAMHGVSLYAQGFTLFSFAGLALTYMYFQLPLMILVVSPAFAALRREWREAASGLGATPVHYWRWVGLPILLPSFLAAMLLLFANAFAAYATPYALAGAQINLATIVIGTQISGELSYDPQFADALALGMIAIVAVCLALYALVQRQSGKWLR